MNRATGRYLSEAGSKASRVNAATAIALPLVGQLARYGLTTFHDGSARHIHVKQCVYTAYIHSSVCMRDLIFRHTFMNHMTAEPGHSRHAARNQHTPTESIKCAPP